MLQKLSEIISRFVPDPLAGKERLLRELRPEERIEVETVRQLLDISSSTARAICETAVRQGYFKRQVELLCPEGVAETDDGEHLIAETEDELPEIVNCIELEDGQYERKKVPKKHLKPHVFYKLHERAASVHA